MDLLNPEFGILEKQEDHINIMELRREELENAKLDITIMKRLHF